MGPIGLSEIEKNVVPCFDMKGEVIEVIPFGSGHINDTLRVTCKEEDGSVNRYILQRMNHEIFKNPAQLMENVVNVTSESRRRCTERNIKCYSYQRRCQLYVR